MGSPKMLPEEEQALRELARRHRESQDGEGQLVAKYSARAALAKQLWGAIAGIVGFSIWATSYMLGLRSDIDRNTRDIARLTADTQRNSDRIEQIRLDLKDKADRLIK